MFKKKSETVVVPTEIVMESTAALNEEVKQELEVPDPPLEEAVGMFKYFKSLNKKAEDDDGEEKEEDSQDKDA